VSKRIYIIGAGGHARVVARAVIAKGLTPIFLRASEEPGDCPDSMREDDFLSSPPKGTDWGVICGVGSVGDMQSRKKILERYQSFASRFSTVICQGAIVDSTALIEPGVFIASGAIISNGVKIGMHSIINSGAIVEHDVTVGSNSHIASGAIVLGACSVADDVLIGGGAVVLQGKKVGSKSIIGAGSVCIKSIPDEGGTWIGVPARKLR